MTVQKVLNNNVVIGLNDSNKEIILMGNGIGFGRKKGDYINCNIAEKCFQLSDSVKMKFESIIQNVAYDNMMIAEEVITYAKEVKGLKLSDVIYITLTDHLNFAIERHRDKMDFKNDLLKEIEEKYPKEFQTGLKALEIIKERISMQLWKDEAAFIAMHIVNTEIE
ncbi:PRD domain-containing protein [Lacrimispora sp.]|uniref:PRD domain-containing protein n=1 Tax=Lacrimispora sp. TaxID=2719234 RepID=UPI003994D9EB